MGYGRVGGAIGFWGRAGCAAVCVLDGRRTLGGRGGGVRDERALCTVTPRRARWAAAGCLAAVWLATVLAVGNGWSWTASNRAPCAPARVDSLLCCSSCWLRFAQELLSGEVSSIDMRAGKQAGGGQYIMTMKVVAKKDSARAMVR